MKLYIKQKIFSIGDKYDVYDENGNLFFDVSNELFTIGAKIHIKDTRGQELYYLRRGLTFMCGRFEVYRGPILCAVIQQEFRFFKPKLHISSEYGEFDIEGDFFSWDFEIVKDGFLFGRVSKQLLSWSDTYELYVPEGNDPAFFAALVIAIDNLLHNNND